MSTHHIWFIPDWKERDEWGPILFDISDCDAYVTLDEAKRLLDELKGALAEAEVPQ